MGWTTTGEYHLRGWPHYGARECPTGSGRTLHQGFFRDVGLSQASIIDVVTRVTDPRSPDVIPAPERIEMPAEPFGTFAVVSSERPPSSSVCGARQPGETAAHAERLENAATLGGVLRRLIRCHPPGMMWRCVGAVPTLTRRRDERNLR